MPELLLEPEIEHKDEEAPRQHPVQRGFESREHPKIQYVIKVARTEQQRREALTLVNKVYSKVGYVGKKDDGSEEPSSFEPYLLSPDTLTLIDYQDDQPLGTLSLVPDTQKLGLPMDSLFKDVVNNLRRDGSKIGEASQFAIDEELLQMHSEEGTKKMLEAYKLMRLVLQYAKYIELDYLLITVNPKHNAFYEQLSFEQIGELRHYPSVNNAPATPFALNLNREDLPRSIKTVLNDRTNTGLFQNYRTAKSGI